MSFPDPQHASHFARLPEELLSVVTDYVENVDDYFSMRQTCKLVAEKTFRFWVREFFHSKTFSVSSKSLNVLLEISRHKVLRRALSHIVFALDKVDKDEGRWLDPHTSDPARVLANARADQDQRWLLNTGSWISQLAQALSSLPFLVSLDICLVANSSHHHWIRRRGERADTLFQGVLLALADSGATPQELNITRNMIDNGVSDAAMFFPPERYDKLRVALSQVKTFHITLSDRERRPGPFPVWNLCKLISAMPNLRSLGIHVDAAFQPELFWRWLAQPVTERNEENKEVAWPEAIPPIALPQLKLLCIRYGTMDLNWLMMVVNKFQLRSVNLREVKILENFPDSRAGVKNACTLARFMEALCATQVQSLSVSSCREVAVERNDYGTHQYEALYDFRTSEGDQRRVWDMTFPSKLFAQGATWVRLGQRYY